MSPFIETIRIEDGVIHQLEYHNRRMNETRRLLLNQSHPIDLRRYIQPEACMERTKCRVEYAADVQKVEYVPYRIRPVASLQLVFSDEVTYSFKSIDRSCLNQLYTGRQTADDVLIVRKGLLTDTSICNVALWDGKQWVTPANPLLKGTQRAYLLDQHQIIEGEISLQTLTDYSTIRLFNALIEFGEIEFSVDKIRL